MKNTLLVLLASLTMLSASAQLKKSDVALPRQQLSVSAVKPQAQVQEMQMRVAGESPTATIMSENVMNPYYHRPAGAFYTSQVIVGDFYCSLLYRGSIVLKPYTDYVFHGNAEGAGENDECWWFYDAHGEYHEVNSMDLTVNYGIEVNEAPVFSVGWSSFQYPGHRPTPENQPVVVEWTPSKIYSVPTTQMIDGYEEGTTYLLSSKTVDLFNSGYPYTYYRGAEPYGENEYGWWFGKNGYHFLSEPNYFVDGIAQAFEKPTAPYLLKQVVMGCAVLKVANPVDMTCRIYKLDKIPAYMNGGRATLPEVPGELIAKGRASLTSTSDGLVFFTLYGEDDGLEYEIMPTIDDAILVVVDGYNDDAMADLVDFSAMVATNFTDDEGYGELAYLKLGRPDGDGNVNYEWTGLNNFFSSGMMKTGFTIYLDADLPYLAFRWKNESGEHIFPDEGGDLHKHCIEFISWEHSADEYWELSCKGDDVP